MADLRVISTGREFRRIDEGTAKLLEELFPGNLERINSAPALPRVPTPDRAIPMLAVPKWGIFAAPMSGEVAISVEYQRSVLYYTGTPEKAAEFKVGTHTVPLEIAQEYIRLKAKGDPAHQLEWQQALREREESALVSAGGATWPKAE